MTARNAVCHIIEVRGWVNVMYLGEHLGEVLGGGVIAALLEVCLDLVLDLGIMIIIIRVIITVIISTWASSRCQVFSSSASWPAVGSGAPAI